MLWGRLSGSRVAMLPPPVFVACVLGALAGGDVVAFAVTCRAHLLVAGTAAGAGLLTVSPSLYARHRRAVAAWRHVTLCVSARGAVETFLTPADAEEGYWRRAARAARGFVDRPLARRRAEGGDRPTFRGAVTAYWSRRCVGCGADTTRSIFGTLLCGLCTSNPRQGHCFMVNKTVARRFLAEPLVGALRFHVTGVGGPHLVFWHTVARAARLNAARVLHAPHYAKNTGRQRRAISRGRA